MDGNEHANKYGENEMSGKHGKKERDGFIKELLRVSLCAVIPSITGIIIWAITGRTDINFIIIGIAFGVFIGVLYLFLRHGGIKLFIEEDQLISNFPSEYKDVTECYREIKSVFLCRNNAARRLRQDEFWIQLISMIYSVFAAALSVLSLVGGSRNDFLDLPSVLFTVSVAILVIYANAQKCGSRARDLNSNCSDLRERLSEVILIGAKMKRQPEQVEEEYKKLEICMSEFHKNLGDSEEHAAVDEWNYQDCWLFYLYLSVKIIVIYVLLMAPLLFVFCHAREFTELFGYYKP